MKKQICTLNRLKANKLSSHKKTEKSESLTTIGRRCTRPRKPVDPGNPDSHRS